MIEINPKQSPKITVWITTSFRLITSRFESLVVFVARLCHLSYQKYSILKSAKKKSQHGLRKVQQPRKIAPANSSTTVIQMFANELNMVKWQPHELDEWAYLAAADLSSALVYWLWLWDCLQYSIIHDNSSMKLGLFLSIPFAKNGR